MWGEANPKISRAQGPWGVVAPSFAPSPPPPPQVLADAGPRLGAGLDPANAAFFCDKAARAFVPRLHETLFRLRRVSGCRCCAAQEGRRELPAAPAACDAASAPRPAALQPACSPRLDLALPALRRVDPLSAERQGPAAAVHRPGLGGGTEGGAEESAHTLRHSTAPVQAREPPTAPSQPPPVRPRPRAFRSVAHCWSSPGCCGPPSAAWARRRPRRWAPLGRWRGGAATSPPRPTPCTRTPGPTCSRTRPRPSRQPSNPTPLPSPPPPPPGARALVRGVRGA
jgi:hypothetical protein